MDILKPECLSLTGQPLDWQGNMYHALTVGFGFSLTDGTPLPANVAWAAAMQGLAPGFCVDTGVPKKQAEWLLSGSVCAPDGKPVRGLVASCAVGQSRREWLASGEQNGSIPFTTMPLVWANTWGGSTFADNPLGCGVDAKGVTPTITEKDIRSRRPTCPGPLGAWPCRLKNMGTYDNAWLQQRWPGVPDDFDWAFFNLAQPEQRLPDGLKGGERLELIHLHPTASRLTLEAPSHQIRVEILRAGETEWRELSAVRDTLWLFPGELTGLYLWHALASCKNESASDIAAVRLTLHPEITMNAAEIPVIADATGVAATDVVGAVGGASDAAKAAETVNAAEGTHVAGVVIGVAAAVVGAAGAVLLSDADPSARSDEPADSTRQVSEQIPEQIPEQIAGQAPETPPVTTSTQQTPSTLDAKPSGATVPPAAAELSASMSEVAQQALAELDASIDEINAGLAEAGLPLLTPEQIQEVRERITTTTAAVSDLLNTTKPEMEDILRQADMSEDRIAATNAALELEPPVPADYPDEASWTAATEAFIAQFAALMQPSDEVLAMMRKGFSFIGPNGEEAISNLAGPVPSTEELFALTGINPQRLEAELDRLGGEDLPGLDNMTGLTARAAALEVTLGLAPGSMTDRINLFTRFMQEHDLLPPQIVPLSSVQPEQSAPQQPQQPQQPEQAAPQELVQAQPEQADFAVTTVAAPKDRNEAALLLTRGIPLAGLVFAGLQLSGLDFSGRDLRGVVFDNADLTAADFSGSDITGGSFAGADVSGADFTGTTLAGTSFANARAVDTAFAGASLVGAALVGANLYGADFGHADLKGVDASGSVFDRASFESSDMTGGNFARASFNRADFHAATAEGSVFTGADMTNASLGFGTTVAGSDFSGACLRGGAWDGVKASSTTFTGVIADNAAFVDCDFSSASWKAARAREADFSRANLSSADLRGADLFRASLRESEAETADFTGANLYNADLYRLQTTPKTRLDGADTLATILDARKKTI